MSAPIVIKIGGAALEDPTAAQSLAHKLATINTRIVLVHGGGKAVDRRLAEAGRTSQRVDGLRVTPEEDIAIVSGVLAGEVNPALCDALSGAGLNPVGLSLADGGTCMLEQLDHLGRVGHVVGGDPTLIKTLLTAGYTPVLHCVGRDATGLLNVNADDAAAGVANVVGAQRLVLLTDVPGVLDDTGNTIQSLDTDSIDTLVDTGVISAGMLPKIAAAASAQSGAVIGSWQDAASLIAGDAQPGTLIAHMTGASRRRPSTTTAS